MKKLGENLETRKQSHVVQSGSLIKWSTPQTWSNTVKTQQESGSQDGEKFPTKNNNKPKKLM